MIQTVAWDLVGGQLGLSYCEVNSWVVSELLTGDFVGSATGIESYNESTQNERDPKPTQIIYDADRYPKKGPARERADFSLVICGLGKISGVEFLSRAGDVIAHHLLLIANAMCLRTTG